MLVSWERRYYQLCREITLSDRQGILTNVIGCGIRRICRGAVYPGVKRPKLAHTRQPCVGLTESCNAKPVSRYGELIARVLRLNEVEVPPRSAEGIS
jgi:hypothetical protein